MEYLSKVSMYEHIRLRGGSELLLNCHILTQNHIYLHNHIDKKITLF